MPRRSSVKTAAQRFAARHSDLVSGISYSELRELARHAVSP